MWRGTRSSVAVLMLAATTALMAREPLQSPAEFVIHRHATPKWTAAETQRGFVVCAEHYQRPMFNVYVPPRERIVDGLSCNAAPGEYESIQLGVFAMRDLTDVSMQVELDLPLKTYRYVHIDRKLRVARTEGDTLISRKQDVKMPYFLFPEPRYRAAEANTTVGFWITVRAPEDAAPGAHVGSVALIAGGKTVTVPLTVNVRPFVLPKPDIAYSVYYATYRHNKAYRGPEWEEQYFEDMAAHGMNTVVILDPTPRWLNREEGTWNEAAVVERVKRMQATGLADGSQPVFFMEGTYDGIAIDMPEKVPGLVKRLRELQQEHALPEIVLYATDEMRASGYTVAAQNIPIWKNSGMRIANSHAPGFVIGMSDFYLLLSGTTTKFNKQNVVSKGAEFWMYDCVHHGFTPIYARAYAGLFSWNAGLKGNFIWAYTHTHGGENDHYSIDEDGEVVLHNCRWYARVAPGPKGPLPSVGWEIRREGIDDYRYLQTLKNLAQDRAANAAPAQEAVRLFARCAAMLNWEELSGRYHLLVPENNDFDQIDFYDPWPTVKIEDYDQVREEAAGLIERLQK